MSAETKDFVDMLKRKLAQATDLTSKYDAVYFTYDYINRNWDLVSFDRINSELIVHAPELAQLVKASRI